MLFILLFILLDLEIGYLVERINRCNNLYLNTLIKREKRCITMKKVDETIARKQVFTLCEEVNGKTLDKGSFWFASVLILANALVYIGDCILNLTSQIYEIRIDMEEKYK